MTSQRLIAGGPVRSRAVIARCQPSKSEVTSAPETPELPETAMPNAVEMDVPSAPVATPVLGRTQGMCLSAVNHTVAFRCAVLVHVITNREYRPILEPLYCCTMSLFVMC